MQAPGCLGGADEDGYDALGEKAGTMSVLASKDFPKIRSCCFCEDVKPRIGGCWQTVRVGQGQV